MLPKGSEEKVLVDSKKISQHIHTVNMLYFCRITIRCIWIGLFVIFLKNKTCANEDCPWHYVKTTWNCYFLEWQSKQKTILNAITQEDTQKSVLMVICAKRHFVYIVVAIIFNSLQWSVLELKQKFVHFALSTIASWPSS